MATSTHQPEGSGSDPGAEPKTEKPANNDPPTLWSTHRRRTFLPQMAGGFLGYYKTLGDCYDWSSTPVEWEINPRVSPYLAKIIHLSQYFQTLKYLARWMRSSTTPLREENESITTCTARANAIHITFIEHKEGESPTTALIGSVAELRDVLHFTMASSTGQSSSNNRQTLRLFLVEDLSRQSIELLGSRFDIDPFFFREHIELFVWDNVRDPWATTPDLTATKKARQWFSVLNERPRYHRSEESFQRARLESNMFNVLRRPRNDDSHFAYHDAKGAIVSITRTRTTIWLGKDKEYHDAPVGIVLIDPSMREGYPLWYNRANWLPADMENIFLPSASKISISWYQAILEMTKQYPWFNVSIPIRTVDSRIVVYPALYTICAEWLLLCKYINTRLSQSEAELEQSHSFRSRGATIDSALRMLATWRRELPVYTDMVTEMMEDALPTALRLTGQSAPDEAAENILCDMKRILRSLKSLQARVDRLQERGIAEMQLEAAREGLTESHNLARLTWLATIFIPLSFVSGLFSMTDDVNSIRGTFKMYFKAAIPLAVGSLLMARWGSTILRFLRQWVHQMKTKRDETLS